ncbi:MAG: amino-acid N-acetyltransferase [Gammaproteobacteria bacterium]
MSDNQDFVGWFRQAAPYIHAHRGRTFVVQVSGDVVAAENFAHLIHDLALLNSLAIKLVVVFGARPQIDQLLKDRNIVPEYSGSLRVTSESSMSSVKQAIGDIKIQIEALLSMGLPNSPMAESHINVASGNYVIGRPLGVMNGVDLQMTGRVRKVNREMITARLAAGDIVIIPPLGYSRTGEVFNLSSFEVAANVAMEINADKLIMVGNQAVVQDEQGNTIKQLTCDQAQAILESDARSHVGENPATALAQGIVACESGVKRVHYIEQQVDGGLLMELFSRDGVGTLLSNLPFDSIHKASVSDIGGILELIQPLEEQGVLVKRSREKIEVEINDYIVLERDGTVIACAALHNYPDEKVVELACLAVLPAYQKQSMGDTLLQFAEKQARDKGAESLITLTTQTEHWFIEKGFKPVDLQKLPVSKQEMYNFQRNSKAFIKQLV